jgi:uncharacterized protein YjiS (DUF1127 family)
MLLETMEVQMSIPNLIDIGDVIHHWYQSAREKRELLAMDDRMLRDIGISRADAVRIAETPTRKLSRTSPKADAAHQGWTLVEFGPSMVDPAVIQAHIRRADMLRAQAMADMARKAFRWLRGVDGRPQPKARIRKLAPVAR